MCDVGFWPFSDIQHCPLSGRYWWHSGHRKFMSTGPGVPNPKFALLCSFLSANFGFDQDTGKPMILVSLMGQKFAR
jgi:hypothetical protein